jgi:hypothetical protein
MCDESIKPKNDSYLASELMDDLIELLNKDIELQDYLIPENCKKMRKLAA